MLCTALLICENEEPPSVGEDQVFCFLPARAHIFASLPFIADVPIQAFLVALDICGQIDFSKGFSFPNLIPCCSENFSVFLWGFGAHVNFYSDSIYCIYTHINT